MLFELIPLIAGGIFGAVVKLITISMENKRTQTEMLISLQSKRQEGINQVNDHASKNVGFAWTRRVIAISILLMIGALIFIPIFDPTLPINITQEVTTGGSYLFGLIDTTTTQEIWIQLKGIVFHPVVADAFQLVIGTYFGASIANRS